MSRGKYSPTLNQRLIHADYIYNAYGQIPPELPDDAEERKRVYDEKIHFPNYDSEGFDSYGYSAFDEKGMIYLGIGEGVDRNGYTEFDYLQMDDDTWYNL